MPEKTEFDRQLDAAKTYFRKNNPEERSEHFSKVFVENDDFWDVSSSSTDSDKEKLVRDYNQRNPGFESINVPDDGNCFYHSLKLALESYGIKPGDVNDIRRKLLETINNDLSGVLDVFASSHKEMTLEEIKHEDPLVDNPQAKMDSHNNIEDYKTTAQIAIKYEALNNISKGINSEKKQSPDAWGGIYEACVAAKAYGVNINFYDERVDRSGKKEWVATKFLADKSNPDKSASIGTESSGANHIVYYSPTKHHVSEVKKSISLLSLETKIAETILENHGVFKNKELINLDEFKDSIKNSDSLAEEDRQKLEPLFKQMQNNDNPCSKEYITKLISESDFVKEQIMALEQIKEMYKSNKIKEGKAVPYASKRKNNPITR